MRFKVGIFFIALVALAACGKDPEPEKPNNNDVQDTTLAGQLSGKFSVSDSQQVAFSQGNLQYCAAQNLWRFAEHQYDMVGSPSQFETGRSDIFAYPGNVAGSDNAYISNTYAGWIDLFGWGTSGWNSGANSYMPFSTSTSSADYYPGGSASNNLTGTYAQADWGVFNPISNSGNQPALWRTLTKDEWNYLVFERAGADSKIGTGNIEGIAGCILLPDDWTTPTGCSFSPGVANGLANFSRNAYTYAQWEDMERAGAVFLPTAGVRDNGVINGVGTHGRYRSSTAANEEKVHSFGFNGETLEVRTCSRSGGRSVRLVVAIHAQ